MRSAAVWEPSCVLSKVYSGDAKELSQKQEVTKTFSTTSNSVSFVKACKIETDKKLDCEIKLLENLLIVKNFLQI